MRLNALACDFLLPLRAKFRFRNTPNSPDGVFSHTMPPTPSSSNESKIALLDRVSFGRKVAYGLGANVDVFAVWVLIQIANPVFNMGMGVGTHLVSSALMIFRLWDAFTDPVMGWISDNTRTRWGRRRPYLVLGAVLCAATYPLIWFFPRDLSEYQLFAWFIGFGLLFYTAFTVWAMPWASLLMEMTPDVDERTRVTAVRGFFQAFSAVAMGATWWFIRRPMFADPLTGLPDNVAGMRFVSIILAVVFLVCGILPAIFVKERYYTHLKQDKVTLFKSLRETLSNRSFVYLILITILFMLGTNMVFSLGPYLSVYYVLGGDESAAAVFSNYQSWIYFATNAGFLLFWTWLAERIGKRRTLFIAMSLVIGAGLSNWFNYNPEYPYLMLMVTVLLGPAYSGIWLMIPSITADIIDEDELHSGERREGSFAAVSSWVGKFSMSIAFGLSGWIMKWLGFDVKLGTNQVDGVFTNMRLTMTVVPVLTVIGALLLMRHVHMSTARVREIRGELEARRGKV
ncbi:MAG: MFS transporter [Opitutales bacterium]